MRAYAEPDQSTNTARMHSFSMTAYVPAAEAVVIEGKPHHRAEAAEGEGDEEEYNGGSFGAFGM